MVDETIPPPAAAPDGGSRFDLRGRSLRQHTARGTVVTGGFLVAVATLGLLRRTAVAGFLTSEELGLWGILAATLGTLGFLKDVGIADKFVQQEESDQEIAFQKAFTLECWVSGAFFVLVVALVPVFAVIYGQPSLLAPGFVLALTIPALPFQAPTWVFYRDMRFAKQRSLMSVDPVVGLIVTVALAAAGAGYWSLVIGSVAGTWSSSIANVIASPYRFAVRHDRETMRDYYAFSWPLFAQSVGGIATAQVAVLVGEWKLGLAGIGAFALAQSFSVYVDRIDQIVTTSLYPAICTVVDRRELLFEAFVKSNRIAVLWGMAFGIGLALFADPLVHLVLGNRWTDAILLLQAYGLIAAANQLGFNWTAFYRAMGDTRPFAVVSLIGTVVFLGIGIPLLVAFGIPGLAAGIALMTASQLILRGYYLTRIFEGFGMIRHAVRALLPALPPAAVILALRAAGMGTATASGTIAQLGIYLFVVLAAAWAFERTLLRELRGYLSARGGATGAAA